MPDRAKDPANVPSATSESSESSRSSESSESSERSTPPLDLPDPLGGAAAKDALAGRPDQGLRGNVGTGAGGATDWGPGMKDHPSRRAGHPNAK